MKGGKIMATFFFVMQHAPTLEQVEAARALGIVRIVALSAWPDPAKGQGGPLPGVEYMGKTGLLTVPDDPKLGREWFTGRAVEIGELLGVTRGDVIQPMGQGQLVNALTRLGLSRGARVVESVTAREAAEDQVQLDGSTKKVTVFRFKGFRQIYQF